MENESKKGRGRFYGEAAFNLRRLRKRAGLNIAQLAKIYKCTKGYIGGLEKGYRPIGNKTRAKLAGILCVNEDEFLRPMDALDYKGAMRPVLSLVNAGEPMTQNKISYPSDVKYIFTDTKDLSAYWVIAKGDSMNNADIKDGDYCLVEPSRVPSNNDIVLVKIEEDKTIKRFKRKNGIVYLLPDSDNPNHFPIQMSEKEAELRDVKIWCITELRRKLK